MANCPEDCLTEPVIQAAWISIPPEIPMPSHGDLWLSTWADDDLLYITWGDGCGPGLEAGQEGCLDWEDTTDCGVAALSGPMAALDPCGAAQACVRSRHVPPGERDDKPSSLLAVGERLYLAGHSPLGDPDLGYIAVSEDHGLTWTEIPDSPWTRGSSGSSFRCLMFLQRGQGHQLAPDGYAYALAIGTEWDWQVWGDGLVHLVRVPATSIDDYRAYRYFGGQPAGGQPIWTPFLDQAHPVPGLRTTDLGSGMYHPGIDRYLFLTQEALFEAPHPWGPWTLVAPLMWWGDDPIWQGGYMPGIVSKDAGPTWFYFTAAGNDPVLDYRLHLGRVDLVSSGPGGSP